jgi:hypothetical protein
MITGFVGLLEGRIKKIATIKVTPAATIQGGANKE